MGTKLGPTSHTIWYYLRFQATAAILQVSFQRIRAQAPQQQVAFWDQWEGTVDCSAALRRPVRSVCATDISVLSSRKRSNPGAAARLGDHHRNAETYLANDLAGRLLSQGHDGTALIDPNASLGHGAPPPAVDAFVRRPRERTPIQLGDVVIPDYIHYSELKKLSSGVTEHRFKPLDHPSSLLRKRLAEPLADEKGRWTPTAVRVPVTGTVSRAVFGNLVAGETLLGDPEADFQRHVLQTYYTAIAVDMESFGVGRAIYQWRRTPYYNPQYVVIRGVSDLVHADEHGNFVDGPGREPLSSAQGVAIPRLFDRLRFWLNRTRQATAPSMDNEVSHSSTAVLDQSGQNQATRDLWRNYAAAVAASFAAALAHNLQGVA